MTEVTDRNERRAEIAAGGWTIAWGDLINEWDAIKLIMSIPTGSVGIWASEQIQDQLQKFQQSLSDVSDDVVNRAIDYLKELLENKSSGEWDFHGLGVKAGIVTYHRHLKWPFGGKTTLANNHQPYIGLRVAKPLPPRGAPLPPPLPPQLPTGTPFQSYIVQTGTPLHETDGTFDFVMGDWNRDGRPDLVAIKKSNTGTNSTEVHILSGASNFQDFLLHTGTPLHETDSTFNFVMGDWNRDGRPDLVAIKKSNTGTNSTEVHILSGASNFQNFILHTGTPLHETDGTFNFVMGDWNRDGRPDLVAIKKSNTGTNSTEVHILSGASNFQNFILHTGTPLHETDSTFNFVMGDWNRDGRPDLVAIKKSNTGTNSTEVHILSGASNFQNFILHTGTPLHETDGTFNFVMGDWNPAGRPYLVAIKKSNTGTNSTEVHILSG